MVKLPISYPEHFLLFDKVQFAKDNLSPYKFSTSLPFCPLPTFLCHRSHHLGNIPEWYCMMAISR